MPGQTPGLVNAEVEAEVAGRPMRADARRNQERLVAAAREVFARQGGGASMEAIAKEAGVGVGTLYRHFPKRIDVVEAVYREDVDQLLSTALRVNDELEPWPAVQTWLHAFLRYAKGKRTFLNELHEAFDRDPQLKIRARERIDEALGLVLRRAQAAGAVRQDVSGADVMQLISSMCINATLSEGQGERLLGVILDGLKLD
jgi:AcrR family transcriptional regulator